MKSETRQCHRCKENFVLEEDDFSFYEKMKVPAPNVCPDCRFKMRVMWRNEMTLYSGRKCDFCEKSIITMYNPKLPYKIYCYDCYYSDKWDPTDYMIEYNLSRPFFDQFNEFLIKVPKISTYLSLGGGPNFNSEYVNMASACKNCYLVFNTGPAEEVLYSRGVMYGRDSSDIYFGYEFESSYESINLQKSSKIFWSRNTVGCVDCYFILNGSGLTNCFGCVNLRNKSNCWFNEQLSQKEYSNKLKEVLGSYEKMQKINKEFEEFCLKFPHRENNNIKTVNSTGDYLFESKNTKESFESNKSEDCKYLFGTKEVKDSIGAIGYGRQSEKLLEVVATGFSSNIIGTYGAENCRNIWYSFFIHNCHDCIGCDSLKNAEYCIFNKQYTKEEYEELKNHIVKELTEKGIYGLMMPLEIAPFAYNETIAQDNMPLTKEEVLAQGFRWEDDIQMTKGKETHKTEDIPDHINDVKDSITDEILKCIECERNYKITEQELLFYRKMILPIPRKCFFCRHRNRIVRRGPFKFFIRKCSNCGKETHTNLTEEVAPIMYCEKCYQQEVI